MSFSFDAKAEMCRQPINKKCCADAEIYGMLLYCNTFSSSEIRIITESRPVYQRAEKLLKKAFSWGFDAVSGAGADEGKISASITAPDKLSAVFDRFGYDRGRVLAHHINLSVLEQQCCQVSFLRGAFLAGGSVTDPSKTYHLELATGHYSVSNEIYSILLELGMKPRNAGRGGNHVTYFKNSEAIEELLTMLGAPIAAMELMNAKVEKDMRNSVNRRVNCDTANLSKVVEAAIAQTEAIRRLEAEGRLEGLSDKLREAARLRLENPEASLTELAAMCVPPVTKSCLNHRLRKLAESARAQ